MYILVSNDARIPEELKEISKNKVEQWSFEEFWVKANGEDGGDGIDLDEGLWFDVTNINEEIYKQLLLYQNMGGNFTFYRFSDEPIPTINIPQLKVIPTEPKEPEFKPTEISETVMTRPGANYPSQTPIQPEPIITVQPPLTTPPVAPQVAPPVAPIAPEIIPPVAETPVAPVAPQAPVAPIVPPIAPVTEPVVAPNPVAPIAPVISTPEVPTYTPPVSTPVAPTINTTGSNGMMIAGEADIKDTTTFGDSAKESLSNLLQGVDITNHKAPDEPGKVILFGSSKGGTGKTFTCLMTAYWYAKQHPNKKIAVADFDIIDGQIAVTTHTYQPTILDFFKPAQSKDASFAELKACSRRIEKFGNIDFYLAPPVDLPQVTDNVEFWNKVFTLLVSNYDVIFFDSGIDYNGKAPISKLYKMADKIIITCNPSINSVQSVIRQMQTLSGERKNNKFRKEEGINERCHIVMTRVSKVSNETLALIKNNLEKYAEIIAAFGDIDKTIHEIEWLGKWELIDTKDDIIKNLETITKDV